MALTSPLDSPSPTRDTPAPIPYRLDTSAVLIVHRPVDTATLVAIRAWVKPRTSWWQFDLKPWHYWASFGTTGILFAAFILLIATHGAVR